MVVTMPASSCQLLISEENQQMLTHEGKKHSWKPRREWVKLCNSSSTARKSAECPFPWKKKSDEAKKMYKTQVGSQKNDPLFQRRACPTLASLKHLLLTKSLRFWFTFAGYLANLYHTKKKIGWIVCIPLMCNEKNSSPCNLTKVYPGIQINMSASRHFQFPILGFLSLQLL